MSRIQSVRMKVGWERTRERQGATQAQISTETVIKEEMEKLLAYLLDVDPQRGIPATLSP